MITVFIVDGDFQQLYFVKSANYSAILKRLGIDPDRVQFKTVPISALISVLESQIEYIMR